MKLGSLCNCAVDLARCYKTEAFYIWCLLSFSRLGYFSGLFKILMMNDLFTMLNLQMFITLLLFSNLLLSVWLQILKPTQDEDEFNISSVYVSPYECNKTLELFSSEGVVRLKIPSQIAQFMAKISYAIATTQEGMTFYIADL